MIIIIINHSSFSVAVVVFQVYPVSQVAYQVDRPPRLGGRPHHDLVETIPIMTNQKRTGLKCPERLKLPVHHEYLIAQMRLTVQVGRRLKVREVTSRILLIAGVKVMEDGRLQRVMKPLQGLQPR